MTTKPRFSENDLGEMLFVADAALNAGFQYISVDTKVIIDLLVEFKNARYPKRVACEVVPVVKDVECTEVENESPKT